MLVVATVQISVTCKLSRTSGMPIGNKAKLWIPQLFAPLFDHASLSFVYSTGSECALINELNLEATGGDMSTIIDSFQKSLRLLYIHLTT